MFNLFRRPKPEGRFKLAHPLREPVRAVGQSFVFWPVAALASIMYAAPQEGVEKPAIVLLFLQVTVLYPIIAGACFTAWFLLARAGRDQVALLPLIAPLSIMGVWAVSFAFFILRYLGSLIGYLAQLAGIS